MELGVEQEDLWGRKKRLRIMKDIFTKAFHVVIWLGRETEEHKEAISALNKFKSLLHALGCSGGSRPECCVGAERPDIEDPGWAHLAKLFQRPWSQKIWTVQKATVSRYLYYCSSVNQVILCTLYLTFGSISRRELTAKQIVRDSSISYALYSTPWDFMARVALAK
jgi:hypothetical protein